MMISLTLTGNEQHSNEPQLVGKHYVNVDLWPPVIEVGMEKTNIHPASR